MRPETAAEPSSPLRPGAALRRVLIWTFVLQATWLAFWPLARFLDLHPGFTDEFLERWPGNRALLHALTGWAEPWLVGLDMATVGGVLALWYLAAFLLYFFAVRSLRGAPPRVAGAVLVSGIAFQVTFFLLPILFTTDGFSYSSYGEMQWRGLNPYTTVPLNLFASRITWLIPALWREVPSICGPFWNLLSIPVAQVATDNPISAILAYKAVVNVSHLATVLLIWYGLGRHLPTWQAAGTALYAWNPLILIEFCTNGHNDVTMLAFLVLACLFALAGRLPVALVALAVSTAIKFTSIVTLPFWLFLWARAADTLRGSLTRLVGGGALVLTPVVAFYVPYWRGPDTFGPVIHWLGAPMFANTVLEFLLSWLTTTADSLTGGDRGAGELAGAGFRWLVRIAFGSYLLYEAWRVRTVIDLFTAIARALTVFLLGVNSWVMPWYFLWAVGLLPFLPWKSRTTRWVLLTSTFGSAVIYFFHFADRTVPVEAIHLLWLPTAAIVALHLTQRLRARFLAEAPSRRIREAHLVAQDAA